LPPRWRVGFGRSRLRADPDDDWYGFPTHAYSWRMMRPYSSGATLRHQENVHVSD
jgi:hypothetical protein